MKMSCYLCKSKRKKLVSKTIRYADALKDGRVYQCLRCGLLFLYPAMSQKRQERFYKNEYRKLYGRKLKQDIKGLLPEAKIRFNRIKRFLRKGDEILEIGCAAGAFLETVAPGVKKIEGVEPYIEYAQYARKKGFRIYNSIDEVNMPYDKIFLFHVLEHLKDPLEELIKIRKLLKKNGMVFIELPNVDDALISVYKIREFIDFYWQPAHLHYFSVKSLKRLLEKAGFLNNRFIPIQRYDLSNHLYWMLKGKPGGNGYFSAYFNNFLEKQYEQALKRNWICDTIMSISKK